MDCACVMIYSDIVAVTVRCQEATCSHGEPDFSIHFCILYCSLPFKLNTVYMPDDFFPSSYSA